VLPTPSDCPIPGARGFSAPSGTGSLKVLILGEALGESEAHEGRAFVEYAPAGSLLERAITRSGFSREQFVLWNVVPVQPPRNHLEGTPYEHAAVAWGLPLLRKVIDDYQPRAILALGNIPLRATTGMCGEYRSITHLQNWVLPALPQFDSIPVIPALHPAFLRRGALPLFSVLMHDLRLAVAVANSRVEERVVFHSPVLWRDFEWVGQVIQEVSQPNVPPGYICYPNESTAFDFLHDVERRHDRIVAYDIETPRSTEATENDSDELEDTQILSIQFSLAAGTGIFMPWHGGYVEAARAILALPNPKVGANTWRFDNPLLEAHGCRLNGPNHDIRWMFHHLQPDLKAALQFVASFYCVGKPGWGPWKHHHGAHAEFYGIRDVDTLQEILI
jgi:uracil-DNA glycosylase family 4